MTGRYHSRTVKLYYTPEFVCPYIDGRIANNTVLDPSFTPDVALYSQMLQRGFRRNGALLYRPQCKDCQQCRSSRIDTQAFRPNRSQRRCIKNNIDLCVSFSNDLHLQEYKDLYNLYVLDRHQDTTAMLDCNDTFSNFLTTDWMPSIAIEFRLPNKQLICLAIVDEVDDGWSDVYTVYHPAYKKRSLGTNAILWQISYLADIGQPFLYLGYYIEESRKMNYKANFGALQIYDGQQWKHQGE